MAEASDESRSVVARRREGFTHEIKIRGHSLTADEPESTGGADQGPTPQELLAASLASCTAITVEMYADRKEWDVSELEVAVEHEPGPRGSPERFEVTLLLPGGLSEEQTQRIKQIAGKCPVHRALAAETTVSITDRVEIRG